MNKTDAKNHRKIRIKSLGYKRWIVFLISLIGMWLLIILILWVYSNFYGSKHDKILNPKITSISTHDLKEKIEKIGYRVTGIKELEGNTVISVQIDKGPLVLFSRVNDFSLQLIAMDEIIKRMRIDNKNPSRIDLRFGKPIVKL